MLKEKICEVCGLHYVPDAPGENRIHSTRHRRWLKAISYFDYSPESYEEREKLKREGHAIINSDRPLPERVRGAEKILRGWYARSLEAAIENGYWKKHPKFNKYVAMMLGQYDPLFSEARSTKLLQHLKNKFGSDPGKIKNGTSYWEPKTNKKNQRQKFNTPTQSP